MASAGGLDGLAVPPETAPMEARSAPALPTDAGWQFEPKWDGFRCLAFRNGDSLDLRAKSGKSLARYFPDVVARLAALITFCTLSFVGLLCFVFAAPLVRFFVPEDADVIREGAIFIRTVAWSFGFVGLQFALMGVLRASGATFTAMIISLVSQWVVQFPLAFILSMRTGLHAHGLWWAFPIANVTTSIIAGIWFARGDWKTRRLVPRTEEEAEEQEIADEVLI